MIRRLKGWLLWAVFRTWAMFCRRIMICAPDGSDYLERWHLWPGAFLHRFHQSDPDRGLHCHPWVWCESLILRGAYYQVKDFGRRFRPEEVYGPMDRNRLQATDFHAVRIVEGPVWTLFRYGKKHGRSWGFISDEGIYTPANPSRELMH